MIHSDIARRKTLQDLCRQRNDCLALISHAQKALKNAGELVVRTASSKHEHNEPPICAQAECRDLHQPARDWCDALIEWASNGKVA